MALILVVDDDPSIVTVLQHILTRDGHTVRSATNGKEGLAAARAEKPDLIILDIMMPEVDGITASGILFQDPMLRRIPVIILTATGQAARKILDLVPNVRVYVEKPFDPAQLVSQVHRLMGAATQPETP